MNTIYFDIETIGTEDEAVIADIAATIKPPGTHKKAETIEKWMQEEAPAAIKEAVAKTSFDGGVGRIVCLGYAVEDDPVITIVGDEREILQSFFKQIYDNQRYVFVGHNIVSFDLKFMWKRAVVLGIKPPPRIPFKAKAWDEAIYDTMLQWDSDPSKRISLDKLCLALGVPTSKGDMDGSMVWDKWREGKIAEISDYCAKDVEATRLVYKKMAFLA